MLKVKITEELTRIVCVSEESEECALQKVEEDYLSGKIILNADDFDNVNLEIVEDNNDN